MRKFNWSLLGLVVILAAIAFATTDIVNYVVGGVSKFKITTAGNVTAAGSVTAGGALSGTTITASGVFTPVPKTSAQVTALTPTAANQMILCTDCTRSRVCISSGTGQGAWVVSIETGTMATPTHCS